MFNKAKCEVLHLDRGTPTEKRVIESSLAEKPWGWWLMRNSMWAGSEHSQPRKPNVSWDKSKEVWPEVKGCHSPLHSCDIPLGLLHTVLVTPAQRMTWKCWSKSREGHKVAENWSSSPLQTGWESWGCSAWQREGSMEAPQELSSIWRGLYGSWRETHHQELQMGQRVMGTNWKRGNWGWILGEDSLLWGWRDTGTGCPEICRCPIPANIQGQAG